MMPIPVHPNSRHHRPPLLAPSLVILSILLTGCASVDPDEETPPTPSTQYTPSSAAPYQQALSSTTTNQVSTTTPPGHPSNPLDLGKTYHLPDLVDLAERTNPETRIAWESTRQAAIAVGLHEAAYYPIIVLLANGGQASLDVKVSHVPVPIDEPRIDATQGGAGLFLQWLLFDFGAREEDVAAAKHELLAATMGFNETHQKIVIEVTRSYYALCAERGKLGVARSNLESAQAVADAADMRANHGTGTAPDLLLAKERAIQANYDLIQASADDDIALANLCEAVGILPTTKLKIADMGGTPLPVRLDETIETDTAQALSDRPDLIADMAQIRAKEAELRKAQDELLPKISVQGTAGRAYATATAYPLPVNNAHLTIDNYAVFLQAEWSIFDGFANVNKIRLAESEQKQAESELANTRTQVAGEVFRAYMKLKTSLRKLEVSKALVEASKKSYDASMEAYKQGLRTVLDTLAAQHDLRVAEETDVATRAEVYTNWQDLAFSMGHIRSPGTN
jgi:outer membrane protein